MFFHVKLICFYTFSEERKMEKNKHFRIAFARFLTVSHFFGRNKPNFNKVFILILQSSQKHVYILR